jgi:NitT/TauT family transport system substrate-binding protein
MIARAAVRTAMLLLVALLPSCATGASPTPHGNGPERAQITVGTLPIVDAAPIHLAIREGYFTDEGLTVTVEVVQGGAAAIPALMGGDLDIAYGAWPSLLRANAQGLPIRAIADGTRARPGFTELLALPGTGLEGNPAGLSGKRIAVNTLGNIGELAVRAALVRAGLPAGAAQLVEIPFPEMTAVLERREVDAIWASEPVATIARETIGAVLVTDSYVGEMEGFPVAGYQATAAFVEANPRTVAAFRRALSRAIERIAEEPGVVAEFAPSFTNLDPELVSRVAMPEFRAHLDIADLDRVQERMLELGLLDEPLDIAAIVEAGETER